MEEEKKVKTTLAARVNETLKENITQEAEEAGMTPSHYVETLLENRVTNNTKNINALKEEAKMWKAESEKLAKQLEGLDTEIEEIEEELEDFIEDEKDSLIKNNLAICTAEDLENLRDQIRLLKKENKELEEQMGDVIEERDEAIEAKKNIRKSPFDFNFSEEDTETIKEKLGYMIDLFPDYSESQLLLVALKSAINNDNSIFASPISQYLPKY